MIDRNRKSTSDLFSYGELDSIDPRINSSADKSPAGVVDAFGARSENGGEISVYYRSRTALARKSTLMESIRRELILTDLLTRLL